MGREGVKGKGKRKKNKLKKGEEKKGDKAPFDISGHTTDSSFENI